MSDMSRKLLDRVVNEKVSAMEKSILLDKQKREAYLENKDKMKALQEANRLYKQSRRR